MEPEACRPIESIAATCALIHDLGNPPFGHAGEQAIAQWFRKNEHHLASLSQQQRQDFLSFEGNAQTIRIVTRLQVLADFHGLNLTIGSLSAACKYTAASHRTEKTRQELKKPGYFFSEQDIIELVRKKTGTGVLRNPIAYIVEACDDIVYSTVDVEDGVKKGVLSWAEAQEMLVEECAESSKGTMKAAMDWVKRYVDSANGAEVAGNARVQLLRTKVIGDCVASLSNTFVQHHASLLSGDVSKSLLELSDTNELIEAFKQVGRKRIYVAPEILRLELMGRRVIHDLLDLFWAGADGIVNGKLPSPKDYAGKACALLSRNYQLVFHEALKSGRIPENYAKAQLITDYVCGMTDSFALSLRNELYGVD